MNYGTNSIFGAAASEFTDIVGDILLTQETVGGASGLFNLSWNGTALVASAISLESGSDNPGQWEHVSFGGAGIGPIVPTPAPATLLLFCAGLVLIRTTRILRRRHQGNLQ